MILPMLRLEIVCFKDVFPQILAFLHGAGLVHIQPLAEIPPTLEGRLGRVRLSEEDDRERAQLQSVVDEASEILGNIAPAGTLPPLEGETNEALLSGFKRLAQGLKKLSGRTAALQKEMDLLPHYERLVEAFFSVKYAFERRTDWAMVGLVLERRWEEDLSLLRAEIARVTRGRMEFSVATLDPSRLVAIVFYDRRFEKDLEGLFWGKGVDRLAFPESYLGRPLEEVLAEIARRRRELPRLLAEAEESHRRALFEATLEISALARLARERMKEIAIRTAFLQSQFTIAIAGWVPEEQADSLREALRDRFGEKVFISLRPPRPDERDVVPVALTNLAAARPFEILLQPVRAPRYGGLDPTPALALFFPIFFGMIVGDIGHGALIFLGGLALRRWAPRAPEAVSRIVLTLGASAIVFGFLFGELFGDLGRGFLHPILLHRTENMVGLLLLSLALGVVHVFLGLVLGVVQSLKLGERRRATEKAATLAAIFAGLVILGALTRVLPGSLFTPGLVLLVALVPLLIYVGGLLSLIELVTTAGNILSYARIMALGLAGVMLAQVANRFATRLSNVVLGVTVAIILHLLNLAMSTFSPGVQALRLQYVEFFSKFYEPGGVPYAPFRRSEE